VPVLPFVALSALFDADAARWLHWQAVATVPWIAWASVAYLGWAATIVGYALWTQLLQRHPANRVAPWQWAGIAFIVVALACVVLGPRFQVKTAASA
jgi:O-acetylserine/cysteine efflux transporter